MPRELISTFIAPLYRKKLFSARFSLEAWDSQTLLLQLWKIPIIKIMDLSRIKEKASELLNKLTEKLKALPGDIPALLTGKITNFEEKFLGRFPRGKRRFITLCFAGTLVILLMIVFLLASGKPKVVSPQMSAAQGIPFDELFIPGEPDFIPDFLPEREPRLSWSLEEIRPYWRSPENARLWRNEVKSAVDKLMEGIP